MKKVLFALFLLLCHLSLSSQNINSNINQSQYDTIYLNDGSVISSIIEEIGIETIRYYKASSPNGPLYVIAKSSVHYIVFSNGEKEFYTDKANVAPGGSEIYSSADPKFNASSGTYTKQPEYSSSVSLGLNDMRQFEYEKMKATAAGLHKTADIGYWVWCIAGITGTIICCCGDSIDYCWIPLASGFGFGVGWFFTFEAIASGKENAANKMKYSSSYLYKYDFDINGSSFSMGPVILAKSDNLSHNAFGIGFSLSF